MIPKLEKWIIRAPRTAFIFFILLFTGALILSDWPLWLCISALFLFAFLLWVNIENTPVLYLKKALKINNFECDPFPLLEQSENLLALKLRPMQRLMISIPYVCALNNIGKEEEADQLLSSLNIGITAHPIHQLNYYAIMVCLAAKFKREEQAAHALRQIELIHAQIKNKAMKKECTEVLTIARAEMLLLQEKPDEALCLLSSIQTAVPTRLIGQSLLKGQAYFMMGNQDLAKIWLNQVLQSGNRLIGSIEQAKNLLKEMEE